jgi:hypothetical protein
MLNLSFCRLPCLLVVLCCEFYLSEVIGSVEPVFVREDMHLIEMVDLELVLGQVDARRIQWLLLGLLLIMNNNIP